MSDNNKNTKNPNNLKKDSFQDGGVQLPTGPVGDLAKEILHRQLFAESSFRPNVQSPKGAAGVAQIMPSVVTDYKKDTGSTQVDVTKPDQAVEVQKWALNDLAKSSFIDKEGQSYMVQLAKTFAAYNWGRGNLLGYLNKAKSQGQDIYNSLDWVEGLPTETKEYVGKILLQNNPQFEEQYKKAAEKNPISNYYKNGGKFSKVTKEVMKTKTGSYQDGGGRFGFERDLWEKEIKKFAISEGFTYNTYDDFLNNSLLQTSFLDYKLKNLT